MADSLIRFCCPKCGGRYFGSTYREGNMLMRHCHDEFGCGCNWSGSNDAECFAPDPVAEARQIIEGLLAKGSTFTVQHISAINKGREWLERNGGTE